MTWFCGNGFSGWRFAAGAAVCVNSAANAKRRRGIENGGCGGGAEVAGGAGFSFVKKILPLRGVWDTIAACYMPIKELIAAGVLAGAMFFRMFGVFTALPVAAVFAARLPGGDAAWIAGIAVGGYGITQALMQIPSGMLADYCGRKAALIAMLLVFAAGGFAAAAAETAWQLAAGRLLQGGGAVAAITAAWLSDISAPSRRAKAMLVYGAAIALAFVVSLLLAAPLAGALGLDGIFALSGWLGIVSAAAVLCLPSPPRPAAVQDSKTALNTEVKICAAGAFVAHYALSALFLRAPLLLEEYLPLAAHWRVYAPAFLLSLALSLPLVFAEKRVPAPVLAMLLLAAGAAFVFYNAGLWALGFGMFLFFGGFVVLESLIPARASRAAPAQKRGKALGAVMCMEFLGMFAGAAVSGALLDLSGAGAAFFGILLLIFGWFVIIRSVRPRGGAFLPTKEG
ncbi:MAG: MFS transporter [Gammaproteobacteria bacterium]